MTTHDDDEPILASAVLLPVEDIPAHLLSRASCPDCDAYLVVVDHGGNSPIHAARVHSDDCPTLRKAQGMNRAARRAANRRSRGRAREN